MNKDEIIQKIKSWYNKTLHTVDQILNAAFPEKEKKIFFIAFVSIGEMLLGYLIAVFQVGFRISDFSPTGMIAAYILDKKTSYPFLGYLLLIVISLLCIYKFLQSYIRRDVDRGFNVSEDSNVYGSAHEITDSELKEIADIVPKESAMGTILGQCDLSGTRLITTKDLSNFNKNIVALAPPGSGKTYCIVLNSIVQAIRRGESVITTDTKGEIWAKTVELARRHGYTIRRLDLKNPKFSDGWDILAEIRGENIRAKITSQIIMKNSGQDKDPHASAEEALLSALLLYTALNDELPEEEKTLHNALTMLFNGPEALDEIFKVVRYDPKMKVAYEFYSTFLSGSKNLRGNIITNLANRLNILSSPEMQDLTSIPDIDLSLLGQKKCIYYCEMPDQHDTMRFVATLFFSFLFLDLTDYADSLKTQRLPIPVNVMIEEAYACGNIPTITNALSTVRSRGIAITLIAQSLTQFHILYGKEVTDVIMNSCATFICLGANTRETTQFFSDLSGTATVDIETEQHIKGEVPMKFGRSYSTGHGRRELFSPDDVRKLKFGKLLIVWQRYNPKEAYTFGIDKHPEYIKGHMTPIMPNTSVPLNDKEARAYYRALEEERVMRYNDWIAAGGNPWPDYTEPKPEYDGPARNTPLPEIIPYEKLEDMVLEHSKEASLKLAKKKKKISDIAQQQESTTGQRTFYLPLDFQIVDDEENEAPPDNCPDALDNGYPEVPSDNFPNAPDDGCAEVPSDNFPNAPDDGCAEVPSDNFPDAPDDGCAEVPSDNFLNTPDDAYTETSANNCAEAQDNRNTESPTGNKKSQNFVSEEDEMLKDMLYDGSDIMDDTPYQKPATNYRTSVSGRGPISGRTIGEVESIASDNPPKKKYKNSDTVSKVEDIPEEKPNVDHQDQLQKNKNAIADLKSRIQNTK